MDLATSEAERGSPEADLDLKPAKSDYIYLKDCITI